MRSRTVTRIPAWAAGVAGLLAMAVVAFAQQPPAAPQSTADLRSQQEINADLFKKFQRDLLTLAQRLERSDRPEDKERAKVLYAALELSRKENLEAQFQKIVVELARGSANPLELQKLAGQDEQLRKVLQEILNILMTDDEATKVKSEIAKLEMYLKEAREIKRNQETVRAMTEGQKGDPNRIAKNQTDLAGRTKDLANKMGGKKADGKAGDKDGKPGRETDSKADPKPESKPGESAGDDKPDTPDAKGEPKDAQDAGDPKKGDGAAESKPGGKDGKPSDDGESKPGQDGKKGDDPAGKPRDGGETKPGPDSEPKPGSGKEAEPKPGPQNNGQPKPGSQGEPKPGTPGEPKAGKAGDPKPGGPKSGTPGEPKPSEPKAGAQGGEPKQPGGGKGQGQGKGQDKQAQGQKGGEGKGTNSQAQQANQQGSPKAGQPGQQGGQQGGDQQAQQPPQPQGSQPPGRKQVQEAYPHQQGAADDLKKDQREKAGKKEDQAIEKLTQAIQELEKRLKQLREEEMMKLLANLEARCNRMLAMQVEVYESTKAVDTVIQKSGGRKTTAEIQKAQQQGDKETEIVVEADRALKLLESEGSAVAFARVLEEVKQDMIAVQRRLAAAYVDRDTQVIEENIIALLKEMVAALKKAQQDLNQQKQQQQQQQAQQQKPGNQKLIDLIAELKLIRSLQMQVNTRTKMYGEKSPGEQAADPLIQAELRQVAARQAKLQDMLTKIANGNNQ